MSDSAPSWKETIRLPQTLFPMKADLARREPETVARWDRERLYHRLVAHRAGRTRFTLHDGPPYANGSIHHGHALNKILKDIVIRFHSLAGNQVTNIPGWDCHGLPIEQKVDEQLGEKKRALSIVEFRSACRAYAEKHIAIQREQFRRLLVLAEFERPYRTMDAPYHATILREVGRFMEKGYVYRGRKPVHWSWAAVTALAEAEVEYAPYTAPSVYVRFALPRPPDWMAGAAGGRAIDVVIWTTTPWTLPSNLAIVLHPELEYELLALSDTEAIVVASGLRAATLAACRLGELPVLATFRGSRLVGEVDGDAPRPLARHPFIDRDSVLLPATYVTLEQGTGCVHTAPGHGQEDFQTGLRYGLDILAPVDPRGRYTDQVPEYAGVHVFEANPRIAQRLADSGRLLNRAGDTYLVDRYPHCWRTKKPLIFRATEQWFIRVDHEALRERALDEVGRTRWFPHWGEQRIRGMLEARPDWCISRQRAWGVPIPAFRCGACGADVASHLVAERVADLTEREGNDAWYLHPPADLAPPGFVCPRCGAESARMEKVEDILDVWFDSGVSWAAVLRDRERMGDVADLYLEGSDQHRGWFHTSLLTAVATSGHAPFRAVLTHGFVVDEQGHKYSKSSANFEPLDRILEEHGADVLRLWVAAVDYRNDIVLAPGLLRQIGDAYRKVRNTIRFLLGNLADFDPNSLRAESAKLTDLDLWALGKTDEFVVRTREAYAANEFHLVYHALLEFCGQTLSAVYLDLLKDRLYCDGDGSSGRRGAQAVLFEALRSLLVVASPILAFTCDEAWALAPRRAGDPDAVVLCDFPAAARQTDPALSLRIDRWLLLRSRLAELVEARRPRKKGERVEGQIGSTQDVVVTLVVGAGEAKEWTPYLATLAELFIVSEVRVEEGDPGHDSGVGIRLDVSSHSRCGRCWNRRPSVGDAAEYPDLCARCASVIASRADRPLDSR